MGTQIWNCCMIVRSAAVTMADNKCGTRRGTMVKVFMKNSKDDFILNFGDSSKGKAPVSQFQTRVARGERMKIEKRICVGEA